MLNKYLRKKQANINKIITFLSEEEKRQILKIFKNLIINLENKL
jgi:hypothetical protein